MSTGHLGHAAVHQRFAEGDVTSILDPHATSPATEEHRAGEDGSLTQGDADWAQARPARRQQRQRGRGVRMSDTVLAVGVLSASPLPAGRRAAATPVTLPLPNMRRHAHGVLATAKSQRSDPLELLEYCSEEIAGRDQSALSTRPARGRVPTGKTFLLEGLGQQAAEQGLNIAWFAMEDLGVLLRRHRHRLSRVQDHRPSAALPIRDSRNPTPRQSAERSP